MKYPFWLLKRDGLQLLKGKWNPLVLSLFIPFLLYCAIMVRLFFKDGRFFVNSVSSAQQMLLFECITLAFSLILEFITPGIYHFLRPEEEKASAFGVYVFGIRYFWKLLPCICLSVLLPTGINLFLSYGDVTWLYDTLFFSLMRYEVYYLLLAVLSLVVQIFGLYMTYALVFAPCILADHPEYGPLVILKESFRLSRGKKFYVFLLEFSFVAWLMLGSLAVIGVLWAVLYMSSARFAYYRRLTQTQEFFVELNPMQ